MKKGLLLFMSIISFGFLGAQSFVTTPNPNIMETLPTDGQIISKSFVDNLTDENIVVKWTRREVALPAGWETAICDNVQCYATHVSEMPPNRPNVVKPDINGLMEIRMESNNEEGVAIIELDLADNDDPNTILETVRYEITVSASVSTVNVSSKNIRVFPNPARNYFMVENDSQIDRIEVFNIVGSRVKTFDALKGDTYSVDDLPLGLYLVSLSKGGEVIKTSRLSIR